MVDLMYELTEGVFSEDTTTIDVTLFVDADTGNTPSLNYRYIDGNNNETINGLALSPTSGAPSGKQRWKGTIYGIVTQTGGTPPDTFRGLTIATHANVGPYYSPAKQGSDTYAYQGSIATVSESNLFTGWSITSTPVTW